MKVCLLADLHLFSSEIGGGWSEESLDIFRNNILPKIEEIAPELTIFLGDILDPSSGKRTPRWPSGDEINEKFVTSLDNSEHNVFYALKGNHDYLEPLQNIDQMGGPSLLDDEWIEFEDNAFYFFTSRYPNSDKAASGLEKIPKVEANKKFLIMHETVSIPGDSKLSDGVIDNISERFDAVFNGHEHAYSKIRDNFYCLSSALPWRPKDDSSNYEITWGIDEAEPVFNEKDENIHGVYSYDTEIEELEFFPIERDIKIATAQLNFDQAPAKIVREQLTALAEELKEKVEQERTVVRVHLKGSLQEGDERIDIGLTDIERNYYSDFYEGFSKNIIHASDLEGGGSFLEEEDLQYLSVQDALDRIEEQFPNIRPFYEEINDLIERKTFQSDQLERRVVNSELLEEEDK